MKDLITSAASILILMIFMFQAAGSQIMYSKMIQADFAIDNFRDVAKEEGCVSEYNRAILKRELADVCEIGEEEVLISGTTELKKKGEIIEYEIKYHIDNVILPGRILNISDDENRVYFSECSGVVSSFEKKENDAK